MKITKTKILRILLIIGVVIIAILSVKLFNKEDNTPVNQLEEVVVKNEQVEEKEEVSEKNNKYERVDYIPDEHIVYINSIEKAGEDYLVKAQLYGRYVINKEEVESKFKNNEKIYFKSDIKKEEGYIIALDEKKDYVLKNSDGDICFYLEKNEQEDYRVFTTAQMDPWMLTDKYIEMIVDKNACLVKNELMYSDDTSDLTISIKEFYEQNKGKNNLAIESEHPSDTYTVQFVKNKVIQFYEKMTSI